MPKSSQFKIASIHFSLFTPGLIFHPNRILAEMLPEWKSTFNGEIMALLRVISDIVFSFQK